jgi:hypothetical protein
VTEDDDEYVAKLGRQLKREAKLGQQLKSLRLLPEMDPAFKQPDGSAFRHQRWDPEFRPPTGEPEPEPTPPPKLPIRHAIVQDIVRREFPPGGKVPQKVSVAALMRNVIDKMWEAACKSTKWKDACKKHGVNPKKPPDANTVARAIGRRV